MPGAAESRGFVCQRVIKNDKFFGQFCCQIQKLIYICNPHSRSHQTREKTAGKKYKKLTFVFGKKIKAIIFANRSEKKVSQYT